MILCSRPMSCAVASTWPSGGRRSTNRWPVGVGDAVGEVRVAAGDEVERPAVRCAPGTWASNQDVTRSTSMPLMLSVMPLGLLRTPSPQVAEGIRAGTLPPMPIDVTDATFPAEVVERSKQVPVVVDLWARVVRSVQDARPDPREGDRRDRRQGRARQGRRRQQPADRGGLPGAGHPGRVRPEGRQGRRRVRRRPARGERAASSSPACSRPRRRTRSPACWPPATRPRSARCSSWTLGTSRR